MKGETEMTIEMIVTLLSVISIGVLMPIIAMGYVEYKMSIYKRNMMKGLNE